MVLLILSAWVGLCRTREYWLAATGFEISSKGFSHYCHIFYRVRNWDKVGKGQNFFGGQDFRPPAISHHLHSPCGLIDQLTTSNHLLLILKMEGDP